jgi:hypothetical protein
MIKFFRTIRQKLLQDNKVSKYLIYALGEILLVVVGILLALQINNWNEKVKTRKQELVILENILRDLEKDKLGLKRIIDIRASKANSAKIMVSYYDGVAIEKPSDYYFHWTNVLYWQFHHPRNVTFKELVNSGNVSIISNGKIKELLLDIDASYEELFEVRRHMYDDYAIYLYNPYSNIVDYGDGIEAWENSKTTRKLSESNIKAALKNKAIKNGFTLANFNNLLLKDLDTKILESVELSIALIKKEVGH